MEVDYDRQSFRAGLAEYQETGPITQYTLEHKFTHAAFCLSYIITFFGFIVGVKFPLSVQKVTLDSQISVCYSVCELPKTETPIPDQFLAL